MEKVQIILEAVQQAQAALAQTVKQINEITEASKRQQGVVARLNDFLGDQEKLLLGIKVAAAAAVAAMVIMGKTAIDNADKLGKQANALGTTVERLAGYQFAAEKANITNEEFAQSLAFLARALGDAQTEGTAAAKAFKQLGLDPKQFKDPLDALEGIADAFANSEGAAVKANIAQDLFGRGGQRNIAFLNEGADAMRKSADEAKALGLVIGGDTAKNAATFNDNMTKLKGAIAGVANELVTSLLPSLLSLQQLILDNREIFQDLVKLVAALAVAVTALVAAWKAYVFVGQAAAAILGVGAVKNAKDYLAAIQLLVATPWAAYTAGIAGAVAIVVAGVEAWKAYKAAQDEALSTKRLAGANENLRDDLVKKIKELEDAGKITTQKARELRDQINAAFAETKSFKEVFVPGEVRGPGGRQSGSKETIEVVDKKSAQEQSSILRKVGDEVIRLNRAALGLADTASKTKKELTALVPDDLIKARAAAEFEKNKASNDTQLAAFKNSLDQQEALLNQSLTRRQVTVEQFSNEQRLINERRFLIEEDFAQREAAAQRKALEDIVKETSDPATREKAQADLVVNAEQLAQKLGEIEQRRFQASIDLDNKLSANRKSLNAADIQAAEQQAQAAQTKLQTTLAQNDNLRSRGLITSAEATQREIAARQTYIDALNEEQVALQGILDRVNELNELTPGLFTPEEVGSIQNQIGALQQEQTQQQGQQPIGENDFEGQFAQTFGQLQNEAAITAATIAGTFKDVFNSAIGSISQGITGLIVGTQTWGQALRQIGTSILTSVVGAIVQMGVRWIATQLLMAIAGKAIMAAANATAAPFAASSAAMWAPAALAASIATYGAAAGIGSAAFIGAGTAIGPIFAGLSAAGATGFSEGGLVPGAPSTTDNRLARVATGEYIFDATSVAGMGAGWFAGLHAAIQGGDIEGFFADQRPGVPRIGRASFAEGGMVGPRGGDIPADQNFNIGFLDSRNAERDFLRREGVNVIVDELARRGNSIGA